jgi:aspartyl-tRNA(Asn)/glutamyl-tRNA(Gln) amidotransferase subunit C
MKIDDKLIRHLEHLARIDLGEDERRLFRDQLTRIIEFVETLQSVDTSAAGAAPLVSHLDKEHMREDEPVDGLSRDDILDQAPDTADGFFRVPPVIDRGDGG